MSSNYKFFNLKSIKLTFSLLTLYLPLTAQVKYEREYKIEESQFPAKALNYLEKTEIQKNNIKYYVEVDKDKKGFEAKFKNNGLRYSVEFNEAGILEDIEVKISKNKLPEVVSEKMEQQFDSIFKRFRILKIQKQFVNTSDQNPETLIKTALYNAEDELYCNYEIMVAARKDKKSFEDYEFLFDYKGKVLNIRKSIPPAYGYILY